MDNINHMKKEIVHLLKQGVYDQDEIFRVLYPVYNGHYSKLRRVIADLKHQGVN